MLYALGDELDNTKAKLDDTEAKLSTANQHLADARRELDAMRAEASSVNKELLEANQQISELKRKLAEANTHKTSEDHGPTAERLVEGTLVQLQTVNDPVLKGAYGVFIGPGENHRVVVMPLVTKWGDEAPQICEASPTYRLVPHSRSRKPVSVLMTNLRVVPRGTHGDKDFKGLLAAVLVEACLAPPQHMPTPNDLPPPLLWEGGLCTKSLQMVAGSAQLKPLMDALVADQQRKPHATTGTVRARKISKAMRLHTHPDRVSGVLSVCANEGSVDRRVAQGVMRVVTAVFHMCG